MIFFTSKEKTEDLLYQAMSFMEKREPKSAISFFKKIIKQDPKNIDALYNQGIALNQLRKYEGKRPPSLDLFLDFVGLTEIEFQEIAESHIVSPYEHKHAEIGEGQKLDDYGKWSTDGKMKREESLEQISNWRQRRSK